MYTVEFEGLFWYRRVVFLRAFNISASQNVRWNLSGWIWDFCAKTSGLIMWLVYPITESLSLTHTIHRNYHFTNPTTHFFLLKHPNFFCKFHMVCTSQQVKIQWETSDQPLSTLICCHLKWSQNKYFVRFSV